jgi:hypothetical protein
MKPLGFPHEVIRGLRNVIRSYISFAKANQTNYDPSSGVDAYSHIIGLRKAEQVIFDLALKSPFEKNA